MFHEHTLYIYIYIYTHIFWYSQLSCQPPHSSRTMVSSLPDLVQHQRRQATAALHVDGFPTPHNDRGKLWTCRWRMLKITDLLDGIHCHGHDCAIYPAEDCSWPENHAQLENYRKSAAFFQDFPCFWRNLLFWGSIHISVLSKLRSFCTAHVQLCSSWSQAKLQPAELLGSGMVRSFTRLCPNWCARYLHNVNIKPS